MKSYQALCAVALLLCGSVRADDELDVFEDDVADARIFFVNFTSSLVQVNATILAYGLLFLAILGAGAVALYYLYLESQNDTTGYGGSYGSSGQYSQYSQYARSNDAYDFNSLNILQWISTLRDMYEKFDPNDIECQKRLICEIMREPEIFGAAAQKFKNGFQYAKYLEAFMPEEMTFVLDEYMQANERANDNKECYEFFPCDFSLKDTYQRTAGNGL